MEQDIIEAECAIAWADEGERLASLPMPRIYGSATTRITDMKHVKHVARDFPAFNTMAVKGRPTLDRSRFEQATRGTGSRWGNGIGPVIQQTQVWGYKLPNGRIVYASTKPKGKAAAGWFKVE